MTFLQLHSVQKSYGPVAAVDGVELSIPAGSRTAIVGPSGCGKTTLLRLIAGFERPDAGRIALDGKDLAAPRQHIPAHRRGIGIVAQDGCLFPHLTIGQNIGFGLSGENAAKVGRIHELMDMVGLDRVMVERKPDQLSGGQQQRVALARALAPKPRLMLLDEPFSALDTGLRAMTRKAVVKVLSSAGITAVLVTHDQGEALAFADQVAVMRDGRFAQVGAPLDLYTKPVDAMTAQFLGEAIILPAIIANGKARCALGELRVDADACDGVANIMIRPEQVEIHEADMPNDVRQPSGTILELEFLGGTCDIVVRLDDQSSGSGNITLSSPASLTLKPGSRICFSIKGNCHIFKN